MFCSKCGTENQETASFCSKCGNRIGTSLETDAQNVNAPSKSILRVVGSITAIIGAIISMCPLAFDFVIGAFSMGYAGDDDVFRQGEDLSNMTFIRIAIVLLAIVLSIASFSIKKPSKLLSLALMITISAALFLPQVMGTIQSLGGVVGFFFLPISLIGSIMLVIDSFLKRKP